MSSRRPDKSFPPLHVVEGGGAVFARAPLRLGLAGGGTDISPYCDRFSGAVLNATIDRVATVCVKPSDDGHIHFSAPDLGVAERFLPVASALAGARLRLHAATFRRAFAADDAERQLPPLRVTATAGAPPGSGLGSSSALAVALLAACQAWRGERSPPEALARLATVAERGDAGLPGGRQDQFAAAFGGVNLFAFRPGEEVDVSPVALAPTARAALEGALMLCATGPSRCSERIIAAQQRGMASEGPPLRALHALARDAYAMRAAVLAGDIAAMAAVLRRAWAAKLRTAPGVTTPVTEALLAAARSAGALAGKVSGAGGGGFLLFLVPPHRRTAVAAALRRLGGEVSSVRLSGEGARAWVGSPPPA